MSARTIQLELHVTVCLRKYASADRYEEYLDKQITAADIFYLEDVSLARQLVELG